MKPNRGARWQMAVYVTVAVVLAGCAQETTSTDQLANGGINGGGASPTATEPSFSPTAVITIADVDVDGQHVTVAGLITQIEESGGVCEFILESTVTRQSELITHEGISNVGSTSCASVQFPVADLSKGPWTAQLQYKSTGLTLASELVKLEIP